MDKVSVITHLFTEIAGPLLILLVALLLYFPLKNWLTKKGLFRGGEGQIDFGKEIRAVENRAMNIMPTLGRDRQVERPGLPAQEAIAAAWFRVEADVKKLGERYCRVDPANDPYPWDYVLFELEMKKNIRNSTLGLYRDLGRLYLSALCDDIAPDEESASIFVRLAEQVSSSLNDAPDVKDSELF